MAPPVSMPEEKRRPQAADLVVTPPVEAQRRRAGSINPRRGKAPEGRRFIQLIVVNRHPPDAPPQQLMLYLDAILLLYAYPD